MCDMKVAEQLWREMPAFLEMSTWYVEAELQVV